MDLLCLGCLAITASIHCSLQGVSPIQVTGGDRLTDSTKLSKFR